MAPATEAPATHTAEGPTQHVPNQLDALATLSKPFDPEQISKLPKVTCNQCRDARFKVCDRHTRVKCAECKGDLTSAHIHLDYVGHADITMRLLEADPLWTWEPLAFDADGLPKFDNNGGLWIRLTVAGHTRLGYGDAQKKTGPNATKEAIGDALRNAAMRFGAGTALWSKSDAAKAQAEAKALSVAPSREERLDELVVLMQKRWGNVGGLNALRQQVEEEDFAEAQIPDQLAGGTRLFGELVAERIAYLEQEAESKAAVQRFLADLRKDWHNPQALAKRQMEAGELGILDREVPGPNGVIMSIEHLLAQRLAAVPGAGSGEGAPPTTPDGKDQAGPTSEDKSAHVERLMGQIRQCWTNPLAMHQIKADAEKHQVLDHNVQTDQGPMPMRTLLMVRIAELQQKITNPEGSAA
jgi:hypothetical protein